MTSSDRDPKIVVRITSQRGGPNQDLLASHMPGRTLDQGDIRFTTADEPADVVVVLNYLKYDTRFIVRRGYMWSWHNEPINRKPFAKGFDRILTHEESSDPRVVRAPPILDWWLGKSWDELVSLQLPKKTRDLSVIASTKSMIPGHRKRQEFVSLIEDSLPEVDVFGEGRVRGLRDKWEGLAPYRYSVAIENTSKANYWTEKISDCFLSFTVPIYYGATNIGDYFPEESFIWLPLDDPPRALDTLRAAVKDDAWTSRLPAIKEARRLVLRDYSLFGQLSKRVSSEKNQIITAPRVSVAVHGRRSRRGGWVRQVGLTKNLQVQLARLLSRIREAH